MVLRRELRVLVRLWLDHQKQRRRDSGVKVFVRSPTAAAADRVGAVTTC